jgi:hypothetical protein
MACVNITPAPPAIKNGTVVKIVEKGEEMDRALFTTAPTS